MSAAPEKILAVDLDGTLLSSDMLYESFWSALGQNWRSPFSAARALFDGKAALKRHLAGASRVDVSTLPYNPEVIRFIEDWRAKGGRAYLVTASDQGLAEQIAGHLGLFDGVFGSDGESNLKGAAKRDFLTGEFGQGRFAYMGDAAADEPVWAASDLAITVNAPPATRRKAEAASAETRHLGSDQAPIRPYLRAMRPHQWLKNILVFLPMFAAHQFDQTTLLLAVLAFFCFSMVASSVYVLNDLLDLRVDRAHPRKSKRPFASGAVPIAAGTRLGLGLLGLGVLLAINIGWEFTLVMALYYALTTAYSLYLKRKVVIDICILAGLYTMRIIAGAVATGIPLSVWLAAFAIFFFLSLAAVKRQAELVDSKSRGNLKASGRGYHVDDLPLISMIGVGAGFVSVLVMMLYMNSPAVITLYAQPYALMGVCAVLLYWITRTIMLAHRGQMHDDPVVYAARDRVSQLCGLIILIFVLYGALG